MNPVEKLTGPSPGRPAAAQGQPTAEDLAWEGELFALLSLLEAHRVRLEAACLRNEAGGAAEVLLGIAELLNDFLHKHPETEQQEEPLPRLRVELNDYLNALRQLREQLPRSALKA